MVTRPASIAQVPTWNRVVNLVKFKSKIRGETIRDSVRGELATVLPRVLEPEAMDTPEDAAEYDAMDHATVNARFVADFLTMHGPCRGGTLLDVGTGTARIPIELAGVDPWARILGADLAEHMLAVASRNVARACLERRIELDQVDAKGLPYLNARFEAVVSNTIIHHVPRPEFVLLEILRLVAAGGTVFVRDLVRPDAADQVTALVDLYTKGESPSARALFEASLHAALTLAEIRAMLVTLGHSADEVNMTSDRHWTWAWRDSSTIPGVA